MVKTTFTLPSKLSKMEHLKMSNILEKEKKYFYQSYRKSVRKKTIYFDLLQLIINFQKDLFINKKISIRVGGPL